MKTYIVFWLVLSVFFVMSSSRGYAETTSTYDPSTGALNLPVVQIEADRVEVTMLPNNTFFVVSSLIQTAATSTTPASFNFENAQLEIPYLLVDGTQEAYAVKLSLVDVERLAFAVAEVVAINALAQYTPDPANWDTFATKPFEGGVNTAHDPDGVGWISADAWEASRWDGTVYNPSKMTPSEFANALCPSVDRIRGIREVFYQHQPFADVSNPTKAEVDEWHRIAINHLRALIGYTSEDRQVQKDHCMFARALWGDERKFTRMWDAKYPNGTCANSNNAHCGATFIPDLEDQAPYLPAGHSGCVTQQGAEGVFSGPKSNIPWALKWSRGFCNTLLAEGFWGGHVGPWFHREKFGFSFWDNDPNNNNNNAILRAKWTGRLMPSLYCNPADADCNPDETGP